MAFTLLPVEEADIPRVTDIICDGVIQHGLREFMRATFPDVRTSEGRQQARTRFNSLRNHVSGESGFLKVVDDTTGEIVATSIHFYYSEPPKQFSAPSHGEWATEDERDYAHHLIAERSKLLLRLYAGLQGPVIEILGFHVARARQGQYVGKWLLEHLLDRSIFKESEVVLIANPAAVGFYEKEKFRVVEDIELDLPERWIRHDRSQLVSMIYDKHLGRPGSFT